MRHAGNAEKLFSRCVLHGMLRFTKITRTIPQGAQFICSVATDDKYKGIRDKLYRLLCRPRADKLCGRPPDL